ncbi:GGDEF domain-containing protein [Bosea sp. SSUT16]|jgi:diguanylate cyclase (GGDEF)-like protein|uniref:GGDEF domain-containing protein n=1 Tax=Bosea spartocytisi TaxID=2773451 RepID=A0A927E6X6_9HYPH|nr:GGDEF domain-containing protein [Bosea spartocytisi]MBD3845483.1 GGDEF domain-containing protein [Bosea spartocytisi]MCT4472654.1 GGDEF domain-containing protein [Bosea spartocytisi]
MSGAALRYTLPRWRVTRWLADAGPDVPAEIRAALIASLFGTLPIFAGGVINSLAVSFLIAWRIPTLPFQLWCVFEVLCCLARLFVLINARRRAERGEPTWTDTYLLLGVAWAAGIGAGTFLSLTSGDWVVATLACLSAAAMVGGICFRNFGAPRMAGVMIGLTLGPCCFATLFASEPIMLITFMQIPLYLFSMTVAAYKLNGMLISTMRAERENAFHARHDMLTGLSNRAGLTRAFETRFGSASAPHGLALIYLDLDGFKSVNDTHGHPAGDALLQLVAERLRGLVRSSDLAARIGGDEFVVLSEQTERVQLQRIGERLVAEISEPYELDSGHRLHIGASVGIALAPEHGTDMNALMVAADAALYQAKSRGKSLCVIASQRAVIDGQGAGNRPLLH